MSAPFPNELVKLAWKARVGKLAERILTHFRVTFDKYTDRRARLDYVNRSKIYIYIQYTYVRIYLHTYIFDLLHTLPCTEINYALLFQLFWCCQYTYMHISLIYVHTYINLIHDNLLTQSGTKSHLLMMMTMCLWLAFFLIWFSICALLVPGTSTTQYSRIKSKNI